MLNAEGLTLFGAGSEWFWSMLQFVIVAITLVGIYVQLRQARAANAFAQVGAIREQWHGERMVRRALAIAIALRDHGPDADLEALSAPIGNFFDSVGGLVRAKHVELAVVRDHLGLACRAWWLILEPEVRRVQAAEGSEAWEHFEWLAGEIGRSNRAHGVPDDAYTRERVVAEQIRGIAGYRASVADLEAMRTMTVAPAQAVGQVPDTAAAIGPLGVDGPSPGTAA